MPPRAPGRTSTGRARLCALLAAACLSLGTSAWALAAGGTEPYLQVTTRAGEVLVDVPLPDSLTWTIEWRHSVAQVTVLDRFAYRDGVMYVTGQVSPYLDIAGLGGYAGRGEMTQLPDGRYQLSDLDLPLYGNVHNFIIGTERAPTVLVVGDQRFALTPNHAGEHARIEVIFR